MEPCHFHEMLLPVTIMLRTRDPEPSLSSITNYTETVELSVSWLHLPSTTVDQDAPSPVLSYKHKNSNSYYLLIYEVAHMGNDPYFGILIPEVPSDQSSSSDVIHIIVPFDHQVSEHNRKWTKDHPLENIIAYARGTVRELYVLNVWELVPPLKIKHLSYHLSGSIRSKIDELGWYSENKARCRSWLCQEEESIEESFALNHDNSIAIDCLDVALLLLAHRCLRLVCNLRLEARDVTIKEEICKNLGFCLCHNDMSDSRHEQQKAIILNLDKFRDILQICHKVLVNKKFEKPPLRRNSCFTSQIENKNTKKGNAMYYPRFTKLVVNFVMDKDPSIPRRNKVNWHYARDDPMFTTINVISRNEDTQLYGAILPAKLTNEDIQASQNPQRKEKKKSRKGKQKAKELETISEAVLTEAEQLKIITKRSRKETHSSHASGSGADEGTGVSLGVPDAPYYDSDDVISWRSSENDQDDDKNDNDENAQDDENDDKNGDDENLTTHDDETTQEEETDEDDTFDPIVHTHSRVSSSDDEDSDNEVEGMDAEGEKSDDLTPPFLQYSSGS
ncbi:hypothetical protein Tco_0269890 [Tanacetum coccineum]